MSGSGLRRELTRNRKVEVALGNELLTRERVERLENARVVMTGQVLRIDSVLRRGFWGRLRWLLMGR